MSAAPKDNTRTAAHEALDWIGRLYAIERAIADDPPDKIRTLRQAQSAPVLGELRIWLEGTHAARHPAAQPHGWSHWLRLEQLGSAHTLPRFGDPRHRQQRLRACHASGRNWTQKLLVRGLRPRRTGSRRGVLAHPDLQATQHRALRLSLRCAALPAELPNQSCGRVAAFPLEARRLTSAFPYHYQSIPATMGITGQLR
jgi:hypothetical protein